MGHWAKIDDNNKVTQVIVADDYKEHWLTINLGGTWKRTSYNTRGGQHLLDGEPFRKNYAGIGYTYDEKRDAFIPPKPFDSWILNEETCLWDAPIPYPEDGGTYTWNEETTSWDLVESV